MAKNKETKLSEIAYNRFKELLFSKMWNPGDYISQSELVEKTGIQLSPIRDALHKLSAEGLVQIIPRKGIQITPSSIKLIREVFHLRKILEKAAVIFFIENAHDNLLSDLKVNHERVILNAKKKDPPTKMREIIIKGENGIYEYIINFMGNDLVSRIYHLNTDRIRLFRFDYDFTYTKKHVEDIIDEHIKIIDAIINRDISLATKRMDFHVSNSLKRALGPPYL
jgi:DNA-binding GntR family transcriptional regulator